MSAPEHKKRFILAIDSLSGLTAGSLTWVLASPLQSLHNWSPGFISFIALANIGFGIFSGSLFLVFKKWSQAQVGLVAALVVGNGIWAIHCLFQVWRLRSEASSWGMGHLVFESAYVGMLAYVEARVFLMREGWVGADA